jgi:hypothetical protein
MRRFRRKTLPGTGDGRMALTAEYKYLNVQGAKLTLGQPELSATPSHRTSVISRT